MNQPQLVIQDETSRPSSPPNLPSSLPFLYEEKRSNLKNKMRSYGADQLKLTPGLDPSNLSTSPIAEPIPILTGNGLSFSDSIDEKKQPMFCVIRIRFIANRFDYSFFILFFCFCLGIRR